MIPDRQIEVKDIELSKDLIDDGIYKLDESFFGDMSVNVPNVKTLIMSYVVPCGHILVFNPSDDYQICLFRPYTEDMKYIEGIVCVSIEDAVGTKQDDIYRVPTKFLKPQKVSRKYINPLRDLFRWATYREALPGARVKVYFNATEKLDPENTKYIFKCRLMWMR